jgi:anti-sigma factor RsiW
MLEHPDETLIDARAEDLLDGAERARIDAHLAGCERCSAEVERQRALIAGLRALPKTVEPDVDLRPGIRTAIRVRV